MITRTERCLERYYQDMAFARIINFFFKQHYRRKDAARALFNYMKELDLNPRTLLACEMLMGEHYVEYRDHVKNIKARQQRQRLLEDGVIWIE